jgi:hypothetical protein
MDAQPVYITLEDLQSHIVYRGYLEDSQIKKGEPLIVVLEGTRPPVAFIIGCVKGWIQSVGNTNKLYVMDLDNKKYLIRT